MSKSFKSYDHVESYKIALLTAIACVLQISESMFPHPVPGLRLGLANMITLVALVRLGFRSAIEITIFRTVLSSLIIGTFMSPTFILSCSGAFISTIFMGFLFWIVRIQKYLRPSIIGISIAGALVHNMVQLYLAYILLVRHGGIFMFLPWLCLGAVVMGWVTGTVAGGVCQRLENNIKKADSIITPKTSEDDLRSYLYCAGQSFLHRLAPELKIGLMICVAITVLLINDFRIFAGLYLVMLIIVITSRIPPAYLFSRISRFISLLLIAFLLPVFFNDGTQIIYSNVWFSLTGEGLIKGAVLLLRIIFLILTSAIVMRTTSPYEITNGLSMVLRPLRFLGISEKRAARILSLSLSSLPVIWERGRSAIRNGRFSRVENMRHLIPLLSQLIADLYMETEFENGHVIITDKDVPEHQIGTGGH